nr:hypothetical protein [Mycoplasmopsis bovis]
MQKFNATNSLATSLGFIASTILSFFLFKNLSFYWLITMNMITYLVSGILYYSLKVNKEATEFSAPTSTGDVENKQDKSNLAKSLNVYFVRVSSYRNILVSKHFWFISVL